MIAYTNNQRRRQHDHGHPEDALPGTDESSSPGAVGCRARDHADKPLEHFLPAELSAPERRFAPGLGEVEAGVLEEDARPVALGFESVAHLRPDDRTARPRVHEQSGRFAFQHLTAHDAVETGLE